MCTSRGLGLGVSLSVIIACLSFGPSRADTIGFFDFDGTFVDNSTASGTLTIDLTTGVVDAASLSYGANTYSTILSQGIFYGNTNSPATPVPVSYGVMIGSSSSELPRIDLAFLGTSEIDSLVSYAGGAVCSTSNLCGPDETGESWYSAYWNTDGGYTALQTGELTETGEISVTPLPAALPLFATALGGLGLLGWRRKRKVQAVA